MPSRKTRFVHSPLTASMLAPLEPECHLVLVHGALSDREWGQVAEVMRPRADTKLTVSEQWKGAPVTDLDFLRFFPWLQWLLVSPSELQNLDGLAHLHQLRTLHITLERLHRLSVVPLAALGGSLRHLSLQGPVSHVDVLSQLTGLTTLTLRSVSMPDLSVLGPMSNLSGLDLKLGGTKDLRLLPSFTRLQYFEAWMIRGLTDLGMLADVTSLEELHLESLKQVTQLPPLHKLIRLRRITLWTMKGLTDLSVLLTAPALEEIDLRLPHLPPEQVTQLAAHPTLRRASIGMGSKWKDDIVEAALPLPLCKGLGLPQSLEQDQYCPSA